MKRIASTTSLRVVNNRPDPLFCHSPPHCDFHNEDGCTRREFNQLSDKEQDRVMKDIYGIEDEVKETSEMVRESLNEMENLLMRLIEKKESLKYVKSAFPELLEDEAFRLQFLRVDSFNVKLASNRLLRHLERKMELFGRERVDQTITLESLSEKDMEFLKSGGVQVVPSKDRGGRPVLFTCHRKWEFEDINNVLRCIWYLLMVLVEESEPSICDAVEVSYNLGEFVPGSFDRNVLKKVFNLFRATPVRLVGYHYCFDDIRFRTVYGVITVFLGKHQRMRARDHEGSHTECQYGLMSYGIPVDELELSDDGYEGVKSFQKWLDDRRSTENQRGNEG